MKIEIRKNRLGYNCRCVECKKVQDGIKPLPFIVYYIRDGKKRGHNEPVCSMECAEKLAKRLKGE